MRNVKGCVVTSHLWDVMQAEPDPLWYLQLRTRLDILVTELWHHNEHQALDRAVGQLPGSAWCKHSFQGIKNDCSESQVHSELY